MDDPIPHDPEQPGGPAEEQAAGPFLFDARLRPHRSLGPRGFLILMLVICLVSFSAGLAFFLAGAWPVVGFIGVDVLLIYLAFQVNYRRADMYEDLQLTADSLTVRKVSHHGEVESWTFQPYWLQVQIDRPAEHSSRLILRSHGKSISIGAFLTASERAEVARELCSALSDLRHGVQRA